MIRKLLIPIISTCALAVGITASAATVTSVKVSDYKTSTVTVSGTIDANEKLISIYFEKQGGTGLLPNVINHASDVIIQPVEKGDIDREKGEFEISFVFNGDGDGGVTYDVMASNQTTPMEFVFVNRTETDSFVSDLSDGTYDGGTNAYEALKNTYGSTLGVDTEFFGNTEEGSIFTAAEKQEYLNKTLEKYASRIQACYSGEGTADDKAVNAANTTKAIAELAKNEIKFLDALKDTVVEGNVNSALDTYKDSAEINGTSRYFAIQDDTIRKSICNAFLGAEYKDITIFESDFSAQITAAMNAPQSPSLQGPTTQIGTGNVPGNTASVVTPAQGSGVNTTGDALLSKYNDIKTVEWAFEAIDYVTKKGIMEGTANKTFAPNDAVLREQVAKIITVAFGSHNPNAGSGYRDVANNHWAYSYISSAMEEGLMNGVSDGTFGMGQKMTRQDLCTVIYRAAQKMGYTFSKKDDSFSDFDSVSDYAKDAVAYLAGSGIISGMGDSTVAPNGTATRAQTAQILMKVSKLLGMN